jgi:methionyl-tRNA synthetase
MINKYYDGNITVNYAERNEVDDELEAFTVNAIDEFEKNMDNFYISNALMELWKIVSRTNKYIDETTPWILAKEENSEKLKSVMYHLAENLRKIAILLIPFMPSSAENIFVQLGLNDEKLKTWESLKPYDLIPENTKVVSKGEPLFMRKDRDEEIEYIKNLMKK